MKFELDADAKRTKYIVSLQNAGMLGNHPPAKPGAFGM